MVWRCVARMAGIGSCVAVAPSPVCAIPSAEGRVSSRAQLGMTTGLPARADFSLTMPMRALLSAFVGGLIAGPISAQAPHRTSTRSAISADDLRARLFLIAHDSMMGRQPGEAGNHKTAEYVAGEFKRLGLEPA